MSSVDGNQLSFKGSHPSDEGNTPSVRVGQLKGRHRVTAVKVRRIQHFLVREKRILSLSLLCLENR